MEVTIAATEHISSAINVGRGKLMSFATGDGWDAADLVLEAADEEEGPWYPICRDEAGNPEYLIPFDTGKRVALDNNAMAAAAVNRYLRVVSVAAGDASTAVPQTAERRINVDIK